jgi:hypothetical protein
LNEHSFKVLFFVATKSIFFEKLEKLRHLIRRLDESIYEKIFTAPYYLHHYGILDIDPIKYELYWEIDP